MKRPNIHKYPWEAQEYIQHLERKLQSMVSSSDVRESKTFDIHNCITDICNATDGNFLMPMKQRDNKSLRYAIKACIDKMLYSR